MNGIAGGDMAGQSGGDHLRVPRFLIEDSPVLAKKIRDFEDLQRRAAEAAATLGDVSEIGGIKAQAKKTREEADVELVKQKELTEHSRAECDRLIAEATATASRKVTEAQAAAQDLVAKADEVSATANAKMAEARRVGQAATTAQNKVDAQANELQQKADDLARREQELVEEKNKLAQLRDLIPQYI